MTLPRFRMAPKSTATSMPVSVVQIRIVAVRMAKRHVDVPVRMRLAMRIRGPVGVLVMLVVPVQVVVLQPVVDVFVCVTLGQVEPDANADERAGDPQAGGERLAEHDDRRN